MKAISQSILIADDVVLLIKDIQKCYHKTPKVTKYFKKLSEFKMNTEKKKTTTKPNSLFGT